jgi:hypothetical protein
MSSDNPLLLCMQTKQGLNEKCVKYRKPTDSLWLHLARNMPPLLRTHPL